MSVGFLIPGVAYGPASGTIESNQDVGRMNELPRSKLGGIRPAEN